MRPQRERDGTAAEHAPPDAAADPRQAQPALTRAVGLICALLAAGCAAPGPPSVPGGPEPILAGDAILAGTTGLEIGFGRAQDGAIDAAAKLVGARPVAVTRGPDCGAGPVRLATFPGGLTLVFTEDGLAGWVARGDQGRVWRSSTGVATGQPAPQAPGGRFAAGGVSGIVDADGRVAALHAGETCGAPLPAPLA